MFFDFVSFVWGCVAILAIYERSGGPEEGRLVRVSWSYMTELLVGINGLWRKVRAIYTLSSELVRTSWSYWFEQVGTSSLQVGAHAY